MMGRYSNPRGPVHHSRSHSADNGRPAAAAKTAEQREAEHMAQVRAVHRRSAYERVCRVMAELATYGDPQGCLPGLRQTRAALRREMIEHGQIAADE